MLFETISFIIIEMVPLDNEPAIIKFLVYIVLLWILDQIIETYKDS